MKIKSVLCSFFVVLLVILNFLPVYSKQSSFNLPEQIDPSARYLFFLHNYYVETKGPDGDCRYTDLLNAFSDKGFQVISEIRTGKIIPDTYAKKVVKQVEKLLSSGVPPENIIVSGHSKGGVIGLCVASQLNNPDIRFVIMAGCEIAGIKKYKLYPDFTKLKGKILSVYATSDSVAGSCSQAFSMASQGMTETEITIESTAGHRLFFAPDQIWLSPVLEWVSKTN